MPLMLPTVHGAKRRQTPCTTAADWADDGLEGDNGDNPVGPARKKRRLRATGEED